MLTAVATFGACRCVSEDCVRRATANEAQHTAVETPWRIWEETVLRKQAAALDAAAVVRSEVGGLSPLPRHSMVVIEKVVDTAVLRGSKRVGVYDKEPVPTPTPLQTQTLSPRTPTSLPHSLTSNWRCSSASCHTQMLASRASQARAQPQKACNELALIVSCHKLVDPDARRVLLSSPKAGATIAAQLFFRSLGLTEKALAYSPWVHHYKMQFNLRPGGRVDPCVVCRPGSGWTCVKIVRSPLARVISSYVHIIRHSAQFGLADSTFDTFVRILEDQATAAQRSLFDDHFMPQALHAHTRTHIHTHARAHARARAHQRTHTRARVHTHTHTTASCLRLRRATSRHRRCCSHSRRSMRVYCRPLQSIPAFGWTRVASSRHTMSLGRAQMKLQMSKVIRAGFPQLISRRPRAQLRAQIASALGAA